MSTAFHTVSYPIELAALAKPLVFAFGVFEGVHVGHQRVVAALQALAQQHQALPVLVFFYPSPKAVFDPTQAAKLIYPLAEKQRLLQQLGLSYLVRFPFDLQLACLSPEEFLQKYFFIDGLPCAGFCVGDDWRFGHRNSGDAALLSELAGVRGLPVHVVPAYIQDGAVVSSTRVRDAIEQGDFARAAALLGRPWNICGEVVSGLGVAGSKLSCPTANIYTEDLLLPPWGVYAAKAEIQGHDGLFKGILYIGNAPTIRQNGPPEVMVEMHLFDFDGDLRGQYLRIEPVKYLRQSMKFHSPGLLSAQVHKDLAEAKVALK
ncbi:MAG: riboflavin biosynthesis protein RibF [Oligosphaeraceae bacterium]|nr:riboflavin biosynthesis protein RibF [Oligosphaeraceae bacterium]